MRKREKMSGLQRNAGIIAAPLNDFGQYDQKLQVGRLAFVRIDRIAKIKIEDGGITGGPGFLNRAADIPLHSGGRGLMFPRHFGIQSIFQIVQLVGIFGGDGQRGCQQQKAFVGYPAFLQNDRRFITQDQIAGGIGLIGMNELLCAGIYAMVKIKAMRAVGTGARKRFDHSLIPLLYASLRVPISF